MRQLFLTGRDLASTVGSVIPALCVGRFVMATCGDMEMEMTDDKKKKAVRWYIEQNKKIFYSKRNEIRVKDNEENAKL